MHSAVAGHWLIVYLYLKKERKKEMKLEPNKMVAQLFVCTIQSCTRVKT